LLANSLAFCAFTKKSGIAHPTTFTVSNKQQFQTALKKIQYPCIIKPQDSHIWQKIFAEQKVVVINSPEQLINVYQDIKQHKLNVILQEITPGADDTIYQFLAFCDIQSKILASFCCQKIRQYPPHFGIACLIQSKHEGAVIEAAHDLLRKIEMKGMAALEFKIDAKRNIPVFMEANLRTSFFGELSVAAGVNFPLIIYNYLAYREEPPEELTYNEGVKLLNIELDLGSYARLRRNQEITFWQWIKSFKAKKIAHTYFALKDLKPWLIVYSRFLIMILRRLCHKVRLPKPPTHSKESKRSIQIKENPKVLHFISSNGIFGAETVLLNLAKHMKEQGKEIFISALKHDDAENVDIIKKAQEGDVPTHIIESRGKLDLTTIFRLSQFIKDHNVNLLHTHNYKSDLIGLISCASTVI